MKQETKVLSPYVVRKRWHVHCSEFQYTLSCPGYMLKVTKTSVRKKAIADEAQLLSTTRGQDLNLR